ncbi:MAG: murein biosynthesis integral membrane protein MurJ, partial [bacterium]
MKSERRAFLRSAGVVSAITFLSRVLGVIRDAVIGARLGAGKISDIFNIAFELSNLLRRIFGEGSLSAFIVPLFLREQKEKGADASWRFASNALTAFTLVTVVLTLAGMFGASAIFAFFGGSSYLAAGDAQAMALGVTLTRIMFPFLIFLALAALMMGFCHAHRHFTMPAFGSVVLNLTMILGSIAAWKYQGEAFAKILAWMVLLGVLLRVAILVPPLMRRGFRYHPVLDTQDPALRELFKMLLPAIYGVGIAQINISVSLNFSTWMGPGAATCLRFSSRLMQFPQALVATALSTVLLPLLSRYLLEEKWNDLRSTMNFSFRLLLLLFLPATIGMMALATPIVTFLFERGNWDAQASATTAHVLHFYAIGLLPYSVIGILTPLYYARRDMLTPVKAGAVGMVANILCAAIAFYLLRDTLGPAGLALASSIAAAINALLLFRWLRLPGRAIWDKGLSAITAKTAAASLLMGTVAWGTARLLGFVIPFEGTLRRGATVALAIAAGIASYYIFCVVLRVSEIHRARDI